MQAPNHFRFRGFESAETGTAAVAPDQKRDGIRPMAAITDMLNQKFVQPSASGVSKP